MKHVMHLIRKHTIDIPKTSWLTLKAKFVCKGSRPIQLPHSAVHCHERATRVALNHFEISTNKLTMETDKILTLQMFTLLFSVQITAAFPKLPKLLYASVHVVSLTTERVACGIKDLFDIIQNI